MITAHVKMRLIGVYDIFILMWISCVCSTKLRLYPRVKVTDEGIKRYSIKHNNSTFIKLVRDSSDNAVVWVGDHEGLYSINKAQDKQVNVLPKRCLENSNCGYTVSLLREGVDGNLLFLCESTEEKTECYNIDSSYSLVNHFQFSYGLSINEPSLIVGDMLFFTRADAGLYRINRNNPNDKIWPHSSVTEKYVKLIAGKDEHKDKVYSFFIEKEGGVSKDHWIPRVSQSCVNDRGGSKDVLQNSWTSGINARLHCSGVDEEHPFTQLIDVATVETDKHVKVYALFRNYWNVSAVCVYNMTTITNIFTYSEFNTTKNVKTLSVRPGKCVNDSTSLDGLVLRFMKERPEMKDWILPENNPLLFSHRHYTHIQVDRVQHRTVLFLALESGGIHKVLEQPEDQSSFIIAEFRPFPHGTHITSMLLNSPEKRLYVGSGSEVFHIDLQSCDLYGETCEDCVLSRDPYCGWNNLRCAPVTESSFQNREKCTSPLASPSMSESGPGPSVLKVHPSVKYYLLCPTISHHASYRWYHEDTQMKCIQSDRGCLHLIESMNKSHEGSYRCESSEGDYHRSIAQYQLIMSSSQAQTVNATLLSCAILLLMFRLLS